MKRRTLLKSGLAGFYPGSLEAQSANVDILAQHDYDAAAAALSAALERHLSQLEKLPLQQLLDGRYKKFRNMAQYYQAV